MYQFPPQRVLAKSLPKLAFEQSHASGAAAAAASPGRLALIFCGTKNYKSSVRLSVCFCISIFNFLIETLIPTGSGRKAFFRHAAHHGGPLDPPLHGADERYGHAGGRPTSMRFVCESFSSIGHVQHEKISLQQSTT